MAGVVGWFERRGEIPLVRPPGLKDYEPLSDDPDPPNRAFSGEEIGGLAFGMEYCDSRGWMSTRTIRCLALDPRNPAAIKAFCNMRQAIRTFRIDRIISMFDLRSGRMLSSEEHLALLAPHLPDESAESVPMRALHAAVGDGVFALLHLAMAGGRLGDAARTMVLAYMRAEAEAASCALPADADVELWIDNLSPPLDAVKASVDNLLAEKDKFVRLLPWLLKVVRSQDSFAVQEESVRELIAEVREHFRRKLFEWPANIRATS